MIWGIFHVFHRVFPENALWPGESGAGCSKQICILSFGYETLSWNDTLPEIWLHVSVYHSLYQEHSSGIPDIREIRRMYLVYPDNSRSGHVFQVDTEIGRNTRISLRILFKLLFAPVAAEVILLVFVHTGELSIFFINYHKTDGIGRHGWLPR